MNKIFISLTFICLAVCGSLHSANPHYKTAYIPPAKQTNLLFSYSTYSTEHFWDNDGNKHKLFNDFESREIFFYGEHAFIEDNSIYIKDSFCSVREKFDGNSRGFKDIELGWKHGLLEIGSKKFTSQISLIIPTGKPKLTYRQGHWGGSLAFLFSDQFCLWQLPSWTDMSINYRYNGYSHGCISANTTIGVNVTSKFQLILESEYEVNIKGKTVANAHLAAFNPKGELWTLQLEGRYNIHKYCYLSAGAYRNLLGRNVGCGGGFFGGSWFVF